MIWVFALHGIWGTDNETASATGKRVITGSDGDQRLVGQVQQPAGEQNQTEQNQTESASGDAAAQDTAEPLPDIDSQPIEPGARSNGRFIPSEQISQDLGVSFPVDI
jgi:hypothetical protein